MLFVGPGYRPKLLQTDSHLPPAPAKAVLVRVRTEFRSTTGQAYHVIHWICTASFTVAVLVGNGNSRTWLYWVCVAVSVVGCCIQGITITLEKNSRRCCESRRAKQIISSKRLGLSFFMDDCLCCRNTFRGQERELAVGKSPIGVLGTPYACK